MSMLASQPATGTFTPEDLLRLPDRNGYELVDGHLVERRVSVQSSRVGSRIHYLLFAETERSDIAVVFGPDLGYQCFSAFPDRVRKPDVSVIQSNRLTDMTRDTGYMLIPPDLAVEVVSPNDSAYEVSVKIEEYLSARFPLIWVVDPKVHVVTIHRADGSLTKLHEADEITGESALPGFRCRVAEFFKSLRP